jgi:hypothetical protein
LSISETDLAQNAFDMGDGYYYYRKDGFGVEIRHFVVDLDGDTAKQLCLIDEYDINGLAFKGNLPFKYSNTEDIKRHYYLACEILEKRGHRLLWLNLHRFEILEKLDIADYTPNLKRLWVPCILKKPYDFTKLPQLEELSVWYNKAFSGIFDCTGIKELQIFKMDAYAAENITNLHQLETLWKRQTSLKNIDGLRNLKGLKYLTLMHTPKIESIAPIQECQEITDLCFDCCKGIADWTIIGNLPNLENLCISNCGTLSDIDFLKPLENLKCVRLIGERMKLVNGNVRWLYEKPGINRVRLPWRKDFDISLEEHWAGSNPERYPDVWKWRLP